MKDLARLGLPKRSRHPIIVYRAQTEGLSFSIDPCDAHGGDVSLNFDKEIRELREASDMRTQGNWTLATSLDLKASWRIIRAYSSSIIAPNTGMITISRDFLQSLLHNQRPLIMC